MTKTQISLVQSAKLKAQSAKLQLKAKSETFFFLALSFTL